LLAAIPILLVAVAAGGVIGMAVSKATYQGVLKYPYIIASPAPTETVLPQTGLFVCIAVGLAAASAGVNAFGEERSVFFREAASGIDALCYRYTML
jgi:hypothetical protein